jgi:hypothetical protein
MLGGMFAGHDEGDGEIFEKDGEGFLVYLEHYPQSSGCP